MLIDIKYQSHTVKISIALESYKADLERRELKKLITYICINKDLILLI